MSHLSTRNFHFVRETNTFVAEVSSFPAWTERRIYPDACDLGFTLVSHKTGVELDFVRSGEDTDGEDVFGWRYALAHAKDRSRFGNLQVLFIND